MPANKPSVNRKTTRNQGAPYNIAIWNAQDFNEDATNIEQHADEIDAAKDRITATETVANAAASKNTEQDGRLTATEAVANSAATKNTTQDGRLTATETVANAAATKNTEQDGRLTATESVANAAAAKNAEQDGRLTATESVANSAIKTASQGLTKAGSDSQLGGSFSAPILISSSKGFNSDTFKVGIGGQYFNEWLESFFNLESSKFTIEVSASGVQTDQSSRAEFTTGAVTFGPGDEDGDVVDQFKGIKYSTDLSARWGIINGSNLIIPHVGWIVNYIPTTIAPATTAAAAKTTPVDADLIGIVDSAASNVLKKVTWSNIRATLKAYFDTLYQAVLVSGTNIKTINSQSILGAGNIVISGGVGSSPSINDEDISALVTDSDGDPATATGITGVPVGKVKLFVNGTRRICGNGVKTKDYYWSTDSGVTALAMNAVVQGAIPYWNGSVSGFQLATTDTITFDYNS